MRMKGHCLAGYVGDFMQFSIMHEPQHIQNTSLYRFKSIYDIGNSPI